MDRDQYLKFCGDDCDDLPIVRGVYPGEVPGGFVNLSGTPVPCEVSIILSFGPGFVPPHKPSSMDILNMLAVLYNDCVHAGGVDVGGAYYRELYMQHKREIDEMVKVRPPSFIDRVLHYMLGVLVKFLDLDKSLVVVQADKGRCTVLMKKADYDKRMLEWVDKCENLHVYTSVSGNEVPGRMRGVQASFKRIYGLFMEEYNGLSNHNKFLLKKALVNFDRKMGGSAVRMPYLYGAVKRHKEGYPIRPICATLHWWTHPVQKALVVCLHKACIHMMLEANVASGVDAVRRIHLNPPPRGYVYAKLDIVDMYTSMPAYKIIGVIKGWMRNPMFESQCILSKNLLLSMLHFSLEFANYLTCGGRVYQQTRGLPQGACDSGLLASIYLDWLLGVQMYSIFYTNGVKFWMKYVDDFLILIPATNIERFRDSFEYFTGLSVTLEYEEEASTGVHISFLDVSIWRCGGKILTGLYRKPISSMRTIHYLSGHSDLHKRNTLREYIRKVLFMSNNELMVRDLSYVVRMYECNGYPMEYIAVQFRFVICTEIGRLKLGGKNFCVLDIRERIDILYTFLLGFLPYVAIPSLRQCPLSSYRVDVKPCFVPVVPIRVMSFKYDALSTLIRRLYRFNGHIGTPVFSVRCHNLSRLLRFSLASPDPHYAKTPGLKMYMMFCLDCTYCLVLSSSLGPQDIVEAVLSDAQSVMRMHCDGMGHHVNVRVMALNKASDGQIGVQMALYRAIYNAMGFECSSTQTLMELPRMLKRFVKNVGAQVGYFGLPQLLSQRQRRRVRQRNPQRRVCQTLKVTSTKHVISPPNLNPKRLRSLSV